MFRIKNARSALGVGWDVYALTVAIDDHGEPAVIDEIARVIRRDVGEAMSYAQSMREAATLVEYCQQGRTKIFRTARENLDFRGGAISLAQ